MPKKPATQRKQLDRQDRGNGNPFDWTIKLIPIGTQANATVIELHYGTWEAARLPITGTGFFVHAETHELKPRVLVAGVGSSNAFGKELPVPVRVRSWYRATKPAVEKTVGFYIVHGNVIETDSFAYRLECTKN